MAGAQLRVEGLNNMRRTLKRAGVEVQGLKEAHAAAAQVVANRAAPNTPQRTGRLAGSLRPAGQVGMAVVRAGRASVPYAGAIHWGWPARGISAQPWIYDAAQDSRDQWENEYRKELEKIIDKIEGVPGL